MPQNHNQQPQSSLLELSSEARALLDIGTVNEWRDLQYQTLTEARVAADYQGTYDADFTNGIDDSLQEFLESRGVASDSAMYSELYTLFRDASIDRISSDEWGNSPAARGVDANDSIPGVDKVARLIETRLADFETQDTGSEDSNEEERTLETIRDELGASREKWATISAKVQGRAANYKKIHGHNAARDEYQALVRELGIRELSDELNDTDDQAARDTRVLEYLFEEQKKLRDLTTEKLQGTKVGKFVEFMNKGGLGKRLLKGVGLGLIVGTGGGILLGAAGAGVAAAGAVAASRFIKGYATNDKYRGMTSADEAYKDEDGYIVEFEESDGTSVEERVNAAADEHDAIYQADTKTEQNKRKKALAWGIGAVAAGATLGYALSHVDKLGDAKDAIHDKLFGGDTAAADNGQSGTGSETGSGDSGADAPDTSGANDGATPQFDLETVSHDARWVESGEGWYQTFNELGIPQVHWGDVLQDAGPKLHDQGWAYFDTANNEWRISQPGRLPNSALRTIAAAAKRDGFDLAA